jgi:phthiodiolone/phenolphthiodiolone dimycocerosates ketoreductase
VTLDHLTGGRAILGIGNGERENTEPYGIRFTRRVARLEEALAIIRRLWESRGEPVDFDGTFWRLRRALFTTPLHAGAAPPIWVAAHAPRMLGLTGRYADGWYPTIKMSPADYRERLARIHAGAAEAGRGLARFEPSLQIQTVLGRDRQSALAGLCGVRVAGSLAMLLPASLWTRHGLHHPLGEEFEGFPDFVPEEVTAEQIASAERQVSAELFADGVFAGSVADVVADVRALVDAGLRHVVLWNIGVLVSGGSPADILRLVLLVRRLRRIPLPPRERARPSSDRTSPGG